MEESQKYPQQPDHKGMAVTALVLGILGLLTSFIVIGGLLGLIGLIFGLVALKKKQPPGIAIAGTVVSGLALVMGLVAVALAVPVFFSYQDRVADVDRKQNVNFIASYLEEHYDDHEYYPAADDIHGLDSDVIESVPAEFESEAYAYEATDCERNECQGYRVMVELKNEEDVEANTEGYFVIENSQESS